MWEVCEAPPSREGGGGRGPDGGVVQQGPGLMAASTAASAYDWIEDAIAAIANGPTDTPVTPPAKEVSPPTAAMEEWFQFSAATVSERFFLPKSCRYLEVGLFQHQMPF